MQSQTTQTGYVFNQRDRGIFAHDYRDINGLPVSDACGAKLRVMLYGRGGAGWSIQDTGRLVSQYSSESIADMLANFAAERESAQAENRLARPMREFRLMILENPARQDLDQTPLLYTCHAIHLDQAEAKAAQDYPGCRVLGLENGQ